MLLKVNYTTERKLRKAFPEHKAAFIYSHIEIVEGSDTTYTTQEKYIILEK